ncbi:hypothetical protein LAZ67_X001185 [Cordylochernes scorpioides]|uniref:ATPase dynein-related AAA domain-containing protein n=1 Tax=Cordylochernes scorpioides TaxID=51811 RepID=A0ABY6LWB3_9ARAC|nr:hypothetical protein LAZ67_X001185 [Cordylochernes scorpioides]
MDKLAVVYVRMGIQTKFSSMNPKAVTVSELYGQINPETREWSDGLISSIFREMNSPSGKDEMRYVIFDGDVDTIWIENMNSVMDDNRILTLVNGERIRLQDYCTLLFEVYGLF